MPKRSKHPCRWPGCVELVEHKDRFCQPHLSDHRAKFDRVRISDKAFYDTKAWKKTRAIKLWKNPLCESCDKQGITKQATDVHHIKSRKQYPQLALKVYNLESLCHSCHSKITWQDNKGYCKQAT